MKRWARCVLLAVLVGGPALYGKTAASPAKAEPDVLILVDGEKLIGNLESATDAGLLFKSNLAGEIKLDWSKVQELHTTETFAAIPKGVTLRNREAANQVARGTVAEAKNSIEVQSGTTAQTIPTANLGNLVPSTDVDKALTRTNFLRGWKGGATAGVSLTEATQKNQTFSAALNMVRSVPDVSWLSPRSRTIFDYTQAYGQLSQPNTPTVKTSIFHIDAEQDLYLNPRLFAFVGAAFDHSFSQGLQLQQNYGGGAGYIVFKNAKQELDVKASVNYIDQRFEASQFDKSLFGSVFGETYVRTFTHGILLNEQGVFTPAWTNTNAYSAFASAGLTFLVYHHLGLTLGAVENFLNDPPPGFRKNSFQFTLGATYSFAR